MARTRMEDHQPNKLLWLIGIRVLIVTSITIPYFLYQASVPVEQAAAGKARITFDESAPLSQDPLLLSGERAPAEERRQQIEQRERQVQAQVIRERSDQQQRHAQVMKILIAVTSVQTLIYIALLRLLRRRPDLQIYCHFGGDLLLITLLIFELAEAASNFALLYICVIAVAAVLSKRAAALVVATTAFLLYAAVMMTPGILAPILSWIRTIALWGSPSLPPVLGRLTSVPLSYDLAVHLLGFYGVAILTSYLTRDVAQTEEKLRKQNRDLAYLRVMHRDVVQSISSGLAAIDLDGLITSLNRAGEEVLRQPEKDLLGLHVAEAKLFTREEWDEETKKAIAGKKGRSELVLRQGDELLYIGFTLTLLRDAEGQHRGYLWIFQNLTEWRKLEEQLRIKDRLAAIGEMAAGLAHEVGNPLAAISGSVQMLAGTMEGTPAQRKLLEITLKESQRLDRTVKAFLQMAHPRPRQAVQFDVAALLAEDVQLLRNSDEVHAQHQINAELHPPSVFISADPDQIGQLFWNLARNGLHAMPQGGILTISGRLLNGVYQIQFRDTGSGMSAEEKAKLFHPFKSFFDKGTGLGMAIVYRIVEEHQGEIQVDSTPGHGSTISVELPIRPAEVLHTN